MPPLLVRRSMRFCGALAGASSTRCGFVSVEDGIDTSTPMGELMAKMAVLMAEWERRGIRDRVRAGMGHAVFHVIAPVEAIDEVVEQRELGGDSVLL